MFKISLAGASDVGDAILRPGGVRAVSCAVLSTGLVSKARLANGAVPEAQATCGKRWA